MGRAAARRRHRLMYNRSMRIFVTIFRRRVALAICGGVMTILGLPPGRDVGRAYQHLLDLRMEHGPLGPGRATQELRLWAEAEGLGSPPDPAGGG